MSCIFPLRMVLAFVGIAAAASSFGAYPEDDSAPDLAKIKQQIEEGQAAGAATTLQQMLSEDPRNSDLLNLLGYASRKLNRLKASRTFYERALAIDPAHKGALEYMGELELQIGNVAAARNLL